MTGTIESSLRSKARTEYEERVKKARQHLLSVAFNGTMQYMPREDLDPLDNLLEKIMRKTLPGIETQAIKTFMATYEKILVEYPHLVEEEARQDVER